MIFDSILYFLKRERIVTINNPEDLEKFILEYKRKYQNYICPENFEKLLKAKEEIAFFPFLIIINRLQKKIEIWHERQSKLYIKR
jgi:hypothetical protein